MESEKPKSKKGCWPWSKEVIEVPLFDDINCPYPIKPSELFKINEVGWGAMLLSALHVYAWPSRAVG